MYWAWRTAVGQAGVGASGLKFDGGPHWKPAMNKVSPAAPARPVVPSCWLRPVCAVPQAEVPTPMAAPLTAMAAKPRKRRRLVPAPMMKLAIDRSSMSVGLADGCH